MAEGDVADDLLPSSAKPPLPFDRQPSRSASRRRASLPTMPSLASEQQHHRIPLEDPPSTNADGDKEEEEPEPPPKLPLPPPPGTYIVQVPREQIYRVPPPENAFLIERFQADDRRKRQSRFGGFGFGGCLRPLAIAAAVVVGLAAVASLVFYLVVRPSPIVFSVQSIHVANSTSPPPRHLEFHVALTARNPSGKQLGYSCDAAGAAALYSGAGGVRFAAAGGERGLPALRLAGGGRSAAVKVVLRGSSKVAMPKAVKRSIEGSPETVKMTLSLSYSAARPVVFGVELWGMRMDVECEFKVRSMAKGSSTAPAKVVAQELSTKLG